MEAATTLRDYIRNKHKYIPEPGYAFYCFIAEGIEFSHIISVGKYYVFCTTLWPYSERKLSIYRNIILVYNRIQPEIERQKIETFAEMVNRLAPKQYTNLAGRTHDNERTNQTIHGQTSS